jgi:hypothetical protein
MSNKSPDNQTDGKSISIAQPVASGQLGDFDFLNGEWRIQHCQLKDGSWDEFEGAATVHSILNGLVSIEELRIPSRNFSGMGLRLLDIEKKLWADYWVNSRSGVQSPPTWGSFVDGVGTWDSLETDNGKAIIVRGVWDLITQNSCRWYQAVSRDGGNSWQENWIMHWSRL